MGLIGAILRAPQGAQVIGEAAGRVAEVFVPNATKQMEASEAAYLAALDEHGAEFRYVQLGWFDRFVNCLNRLPRPMLALGTLGLFVYAMVAPEHFSRRMVGLGLVPEPLWWLLTAVVGFYFGAREAHYFRLARPVPPTKTKESGARAAGQPADDAPAISEDGAGNSALAALRERAGGRDHGGRS